MELSSKKIKSLKIIVPIVLVGLLIISTTFLLFSNKKEVEESGNTFFNELTSKKEKLKTPVAMNLHYPSASDGWMNDQIDKYVESLVSDVARIAEIEAVKKFDLTYETYNFSEELVSFVFESKITYKDTEEANIKTEALTINMHEEKQLQLLDLFDNKVMLTKFIDSATKGEELDVESLLEIENFYVDDDGVFIKTSKHSDFVQVERMEYLQEIYQPYVDGQEPESLADLENKKIEDLKKEYEGKKLIALTFDDGPHPENTQRLLDILERKDVKVSFFLLGRFVKLYPELVYNELEQGHDVGSHSYSHPNFKEIDKKEMESEIKKTQDVIYEATGASVKLFRPPYGAFNDEVKTKAEAALVLWDVDSVDWMSRDKDEIINKALEGVKDGSIILMHDTYAETIDAIEAIIDRLHEDGFTIVTVDTLLKVRRDVVDGEAYFNALP